MAVAGRKAIVKVTGAPLALTVTPATDVNGDGSVIQVTDPTKRILDRAAQIDVFKGGSLWGSTAVPGTLGSINRLNGKATLIPAAGAGGSYNITSTYLPAANVIEGKSWMYELTAVNVNVPKFQDIWEPKLVCLKDAKGKIGLWKTTDETLVNLVLAGAPLVVDFYDDATQAFDLRMWAIPSKEARDALVSGLVNQDFEFESTPDVDGHVATNT